MRYVLLLILINLFWCATGFSSSLICSQDFESAGWEDDFTGESSWSDNITTTTSSPHGGTKSIRWNQYNGLTDGITGFPGIGNSLFDYRGPPGSLFTNSTPNACYISFWFRHDDYTNTMGDGGAKKMFFMIDDTYGIKSMYMRNQLGTVDTIRMKYSNGGVYSDAWAYANWGYSSMYLTNANITHALNGTWRKFEIYFNYNDNYFTVWVDGYKMLPKSDGSNATYWSLYPVDAAAGRIKWDPNLTLHYKGIQLFYYDYTRDLSGAADGSGYYSGVQIDDIEVWNGMPDETPDTTDPYTDNWNPSKSETDVAKDTTIVVHVLDAGDGVDISTISLGVEGVAYTQSDSELVITGTSADYTLTYTNDGDFSYDQVVNVTVDADDIAGTPNSMTQDVYLFTIESEPPTPPTSVGKKVIIGGNTKITLGNNVELKVN